MFRHLGDVQRSNFWFVFVDSLILSFTFLYIQVSIEMVLINVSTGVLRLIQTPSGHTPIPTSVSVGGS